MRTRKVTPTEVRFWAKVEKTDGCWLWLGKPGRSGYGTIATDHENTRVHRYSWELANGPIPSGLVVRHFVCRDRLCVRPDHLAIGTAADNIADMVRDGTQARGERHGHRTKPQSTPRGETSGLAKLTEAQVREIRRVYAAGGVTWEQVGAMFGVSKPLVGKIVRGELWKHVPIPPEHKAHVWAKRGEGKRGAKLTEREALALIEMRAKGVTVAAAAKAVGVGRSTASSVVYGFTWKHLPRPGAPASG